MSVSRVKTPPLGNDLSKEDNAAFDTRPDSDNREGDSTLVFLNNFMNGDQE